MLRPCPEDGGAEESHALTENLFGYLVREHYSVESKSQVLPLAYLDLLVIIKVMVPRGKVWPSRLQKDQN